MGHYAKKRCALLNAMLFCTIILFLYLSLSACFFFSDLTIKTFEGRLYCLEGYHIKWVAFNRAYPPSQLSFPMLPIYFTHNSSGCEM